MSRRNAFLVFTAAALLRAGLLGAFDLMPQSAYYFTYAQHPALSYYDHPGMIGWLLAAWASLLGKSVWTIRLATFTTTLASQLAFWGLAGALFGRHGQEEAPGGDDARSRSLALYATTGMATLLSFIAVPDVPLVLFWTLALWALHAALFSRRAPRPPGEAGGAAVEPASWGRWLAAGGLMGLAFLSKYTAVYLQGGLVLFLLASRSHRRLLRRPQPWAALVVAQLVSLPVYVWNARHGFASFAYQSVGRAGEIKGLALGDALGFLASQMTVFLPVPLVAFLWLAGRDLWRAARTRLRIEPDRLFLLSFSVPVFATCIALSTITWVKSNWPMPAYVAAALLVGASVGRRALRWHLATAAVLHVLLAIQLVWYPFPVSSDDTWYGWSELAGRVEQRVDAVERSTGREPFVFSADHYKTTAELRFYSDLPAYGMNVIGWNALQYEYIGEDPADLAGRDALFIRSEVKRHPTAATDRYLERIHHYFGSVRELEPIEIRLRGRTVRLFRVFYCTDYRGPGGTIGPHV